MSAETLALKYPSSRRPTEVLTNERASISIAFNHTQNVMPPGKVAEFRSQMTEYLTWALSRAREHTLALVADVPPERMQLQSRPGERHPTWLLGHLLLADTYLLSRLSVQPLAEEFWSLLQQFGPESVPDAVAATDSKDGLVERLVRTNTARIRRVAEMTPGDLDRPLSDPVLARAQPTMGHHLCALIAHEGYHGGQLSAWRRAHGFPAVGWRFGPRPDEGAPDAGR